MSGFSQMTESMSQDAHYEQSNGAKMRLVHPTDAVSQFSFMGATGAIEMEIAHFGRF